MRKKAGWPLIPQHSIEASEKSFVVREYQQAAVRLEHFLGEDRYHLLGRRAR
jgi:hypothetical protein